jgi:porin
VNVIDLQSQSPFFGGWGVERFQNLALVVPPTGVTPLTLMAGSLSQQIGAVTLTAMVYDPSDRAQNTFQGLFANGVNLSLGAQWNGRLWQRNSSIGLTAIASSVRSVSLSDTYLPSPLRQEGLLSPSNLTLNVGHQLWASPVRPGQGIGFYGRFGITGGDPNPIQASMAMGVSGAGLWHSRPWDGFGIGVFRSNWSNGLSTTVLTPLRPERGLELYYNLAITPWLSLTPDLQVIQPATAGTPLLTVLGLRTLLRF